MKPFLYRRTIKVVRKAFTKGEYNMVSNSTENLTDHQEDVFISESQVQIYKERGYNDDVLPKTKEKRNMSIGNYFTLWMGSVHNIPNYAAVGGFLFLEQSLNVLHQFVTKKIKTVCGTN